jgi:ABC-type transporter Mla subunit MlaD
MRRLVAMVVLVALATTGVAVLTAAGPGSQTKTYKIVFDNSFGLTEGGDFKIAGVRAGETSRFTVSKERPRKAVVETKLSVKGVGKLREDSLCDIKPQSLIGEYFVDCREGKGKPLEDGATLPVSRTSSTIPIDLVNNILRLPYRERLRLIIAELGTGLAGRPQDLAEVLRRAHPGLRETSRTLNILAGQRRVINQFIGDASTVVSELDKRKADVGRWVTEAGEAAEISASRRADLRRNFQLLPRTLAELRPYMVQLRRLADEQIPTLRDLRRAAPDLNRLFARLGPFADASRPAFRALGRTSDAGVAALRETRQEVEALQRLGRESPGFAKPLRQFLQTMDDRRRSVEDDPRATATAPPRPDKTAATGRPNESGFTGFEAFWNYAFWQALAINGRDDIGHLLRINVRFGACENYRATREDAEEVFDECQQWLGPDQPGVTTPDPTAGGSSSSRSRTARKAGAPAAAGRDADRSGEGGSADSPSTPQGAQRRASGLLDDLLGGALGGTGAAPKVRPKVLDRDSSANAGSEQMLLDYLLKP